MTSEEFRNLIEVTEDPLRRTIDVRKAGDRESEAVDFYFSGILAEIQNGSFANDGKSIVVVSDRLELFGEPTLKLYAKLLAGGVPIEIRYKNS